MKKLFSSGAALLTLMAALPAVANPVPWKLNMTQGVTSTAATAYEMHMLMLWICIIIGIIVFGVMFFAMFRFRKSQGAVPDTTFVHSNKIEAIWTTVPVLILIGMAYPATQKLMFMFDTRDAALTVKVTGYQWKWRYQVVNYEGRERPVNFISTLAFDSNKARQLHSGIDPTTVPNYLLDVDKPLVVPIHTKIRFLFTAEDVIHAWWVPDLGWKQDAIPGQINEAWTDINEVGMYRGQCAELCGKDHGFMPIVVKAVDKAEFEQWLTDNSTPAPDVALAAASAATPAVAGTH